MTVDQSNQHLSHILVDIPDPHKDRLQSFLNSSMHQHRCVHGILHLGRMELGYMVLLVAQKEMLYEYNKFVTVYYIYINALKYIH